jgi:predicted Ser/Thr protein kinase
MTVDSSNRINLSAKNGEKISFNSNEMLKKLLTHKEFKSQKTDNERFEVPNSLMLLTQNFKDYTFVCRFERINGGYKTKAKKEISNIYFNGYLIIYPKK